jgi:hypothetical protein
LDSLCSKILNSLISSVKILEERMKSNIIVCGNDKIDFKNKLCSIYIAELWKMWEGHKLDYQKVFRQ